MWCCGDISWSWSSSYVWIIGAFARWNRYGWFSCIVDIIWFRWFWFFLRVNCWTTESWMIQWTNLPIEGKNYINFVVVLFWLINAQHFKCFPDYCAKQTNKLLLLLIFWSTNLLLNKKEFLLCFVCVCCLFCSLLRSSLGLDFLFPCVTFLIYLVVIISICSDDDSYLPKRTKFIAIWIVLKPKSTVIRSWNLISLWIVHAKIVEKVDKESHVIESKRGFKLLISNRKFLSIEKSDFF